MSHIEAFFQTNCKHSFPVFWQHPSAMPNNDLLLGKNIAFLVDEKELCSRGELARAADVTESLIGQLIRGRVSGLNPVSLIKAAKRLNTTAEMLVTLDFRKLGIFPVGGDKENIVNDNKNHLASINSEWLRICILGTMDALGHEAISHIAKFAAHAYKNCQRTDTIPSRKGVADYVNSLLEELGNEGRGMGASEKKGS